MRLVFGFFLVVHGLIHVLWLIDPDGPPWPFGLTDSWPLGGVHAPEGWARGVAVTLALDVGLLVATIAGRRRWSPDAPRRMRGCGATA